jgi:hypothetical protein
MSGLPVGPRTINPGDDGATDTKRIRELYPWHNKIVGQTDQNLLPRPGGIAWLYVLNLGATQADFYLRDANAGSGIDATAQRFLVPAGAERWFEVRRLFQICGRIQGSVPALCEINAIGE